MAPSDGWSTRLAHWVVAIGLAASSPPVAHATPTGSSIDLVLVDARCGGEFRAAAELLAAGHRATVAEADLDDAVALESVLRSHTPSHVVFVVEPAHLDLDLTHRVLETSTRVDSDPFPDFAHGFVTGLDGAAARRFVQAMLAARTAPRSRALGVLGVSENTAAAPQPLGAELARACALSFAFEGLPSVEASPRRRRDALERLGHSDLLMLFSHGEPDRMIGAFRGSELRSWAVDFDGRIVVNCACFNGSMGEAVLPGANGLQTIEVAPDESVALAMLDTGVAGYVAGIDAWHGPLAVQVVLALADDGASLGDAVRRPIDRLVLSQQDRPLRFPAQHERSQRFSAEPGAFARGNAAGSVLFGDPSFAPFRDGAPRAFAATLDGTPDRRSVRIELAPVPGVGGGYGSMLLLPRVLAYFEPIPNPPTTLPLELHRVVDWPADEPRPRSWRVTRATCGDEPLQCLDVVTAYEDTPHGPRLHVVVPLATATGLDGVRLRTDLARLGATVVVEPTP